MLAGTDGKRRDKQPGNRLVKPMVYQAAENYASTILGAEVVAGSLPEDLAMNCLKHLSRSEEVADTVDAWGNWEGKSGKPGEGYRQAFLDRSILNWAASKGVLRRHIWPEGAEWAVCLTHDMDFVNRYARWSETVMLLSRLCRGGAGLQRTLRRVGGGLLRSAGGFRADPWWCFEKWTNMALEAGTPSTWMVFPQTVSKPHPWDAAYSYGDTVCFNKRKMRVSEMLRELRCAGMEVGLHPSIHAARDVSLLKDQRRQVEQAVGCDVTSVRQHFLRWDAGHTPKAQIEAGLKLDSTLGFNRGVGFRNGGCYPYQMPDPVTGEVTSLIQIPLQLMDVALFSEDGLGCRTPDEAIACCMEVMEEVQAVGGVLVLNWHPNSITNDSMMAVIRNLLEEVRRRRAWGATLKDVAAHWEKREWIKHSQAN